MDGSRRKDVRGGDKELRAYSKNTVEEATRSAAEVACESVMW